jgi:hypothetical protein
MLDRYSLEKLINAYGAEALKRAAEDRLASAAVGQSKIRRAWPLAARLRALASSGLRAPRRTGAPGAGSLGDLSA